MAEPDRYEVLDVVGTGGMATVWRARDRELGRVVALKRPHPAPAGSDVHARFDREARMAAAVSHPNLIEVYDVGRDDAGPYLVMEFVDASSLATEPVDPDAAARVGAEIGDGLATLHAAGIVHRDVKPGNVLLASGGAKLTDFGIARNIDATALTQPGVTHGTPAYAAPEVLERGAHSPASDVYSLAAVVFEIVTGSRYSPAGVSQLVDPWRAVLEPALSPQPEGRPTAEQLATRLRLIADRGVAPPIQPPTAAMTTPMRGPAPMPLATDAVGGGAGRYEARAAIILFIALVATVGVVIFAATRDGGNGGATASAGSSDGTSPSALTTRPTVAVMPAHPSTTDASTTTTSTSTSTTSTSTSTSTTAPPDELPATPDGTRDALLGFVDQSNLLGRGNPRKQFESHLDRAIERWSDGRESDAIVDQLRDAAKELDKRADGDVRTELFTLLAHLADQLDVDPDEVIGEFDDDDDDDDD